MQAPQTPSPDTAKAIRPVYALLVLLALAGAALSPVLFAGFIRLDDYHHILETPELLKPSPSGVARFWSKPYFGLYIPITYSLWSVVSAVGQAFGPVARNAWLFHALNLACHLANAGLVLLVADTLFVAARRRHAELALSAGRPIALLVALVFALHPVQVETVAWISELKGELATMAGLLAIWHYYRSPKRVLTGALLVASMLCKPSAIVFPGVLFLVDRILLGKTLKESAVTPAILTLPLLPFVFVTKHLQPNLNMDFIPTLSERSLVAIDALAFYLAKLAAPFGLALDYGRSPQWVLGHVAGWRTAISAVLVLAAVGVVAHALVRPRQSGAGQGFYAIASCGLSILILSVLPVLGLVPFEFQGFSTVADHYLYLAVFGAALVVAGILFRLRASPLSLGVAMVGVLVLAGLAYRQAKLWRSTETLFAHTLTVNPQSYLAHYSIAAELLDAGRLDEGLDQNRKSLAINPDYLHANVALGVAWIRKGDYQAAVDHYLSFLAKNPNSAGKRAMLVASIHNNVGMALHQVGRDAEGTQHFRKAVEVDPESMTGHLNLGNAAFNDKRYLDAIAEYEIAASLSPGNPTVEQQLALARQGARRVLRSRVGQPSSP